MTTPDDRNSPAAELRPFHLAIPVNDLAAAESFYCGLLGCSKGRTASCWTDLNFFGHQLSLHLSESECPDVVTNPVNGEQATMFLLDPSGNALEYKSFADPTQLFAT